MSQSQPHNVPAPPQPLPEDLWGDHWQFVSLRAEDLELGLWERPIPIKAGGLLPSQLQLDPSLAIPGVIIEAGRQSMALARWLVAQQPLQLEAVNLELGALILTTMQDQRWILATYQDSAVREAAMTFQSRKTDSSKLHFLLIQPDDSGVTHTGLWILQG